ncbi:MAG: AAA family ATPase [Dehalococcoidia bacterium]|nr:AAA family ATPase [Dehalococcoidia bacterium]MDW8119808.1 AAA family ATPase [Chloroflexota bacterium]
MAHPALVRDLLRPEAYPSEERPQAVQLVETHISWLFLTGRYVYKVKKPVDFGFLDFTTLEKRRHFCHEEVRLNRRLSPSVYLGVVEVYWDGLHHSFVGPGEVVDYAVKMVHLPRERTLSALLQTHQVSAAQIRAVARRIAQFHATADTNPAITQMGGLDTVRHNIQENFIQTERYQGRSISPQTYDLLRAYSEAFMEVHAPLFAQRQAQGRIRDGHGDLHTGQIYLLDADILFLDCIEFNERFRWADVCADVAFLAMDLDYHARPDLSQALVDEYVRISGDTGLLALLNFYKTYRAYVRGKVESFRLDEEGLSAEERQTILQRAQRYFALAEGYGRVLQGPALILVVGLIGTGKSTLARNLASLLGGEVISSDVVRKTLAGLAPTDRRWEPWGQGIYSPTMDLRTYQAMLEQADALLAQGKVVILDASFRSAARRQEAIALARRRGIPYFVVEAYAPEEVVRERLLRRQEHPHGPSDGRLELLPAFREHFDPLTDIPTEHLVRVNTSGPPRESAYQALKGLLRLVLAQSPSPSTHPLEARPRF